MPRTSGGSFSFLIPGASVVGTNQAGCIAASDFRLHHVELWGSTAPTGSTLIIDLNINGLTAYSTQANRPTIAIGSKVGTRIVPDITAVAAGDLITVDIDQIGSTVAGGNPLVISAVLV